MKRYFVLAIVCVLLLVGLAPQEGVQAGCLTKTITTKTCIVDDMAVTHVGLVDLGGEFVGGWLRVINMGGGITEYGYWTPAGGYTTLGWSWVYEDVVQYSVPEGGPYSLEALTEVLSVAVPPLPANCQYEEVTMVCA